MRGSICCALLGFAMTSAAMAASPRELANPEIDSAGYLRAATQAGEHRATRRLTEDEFIAMSKLPGTLILDARSRPRYDALHVRDAINLSFPDITIDSLAQLLPDRTTRILIYCNNNFTNAQDPFPSKLPASALNLATYTTLYNYGYRNVYELGPLLDVRTTRIPLEGSRR